MELIISNRRLLCSIATFLLIVLVYNEGISYLLGGLFQNLFLDQVVTDSSLLNALFILGGGGGGSSEGLSISVHSTSVSFTDPTTGVTYSGTMGANGSFACSNGETFGGVGPNGTVSTPFLRVWDGKKFVLENDFLFGKPNTCFINKEVGEGQYKSGAIGGDTYVLQTDPVKSDGLLKMQIREIEPEESFIDSLSILSLDLKPREHLVADGGLKAFHVFDIDKTTTVSDRNVYVSSVGTTTPVPTKLAYDQLGEGYGRSLILNTGDELVLRVSKTDLSKEDDLFILVDSHYRDWTLGHEVPFTLSEKLGMKVHSLARTSFSFAAGCMMFIAGLFGFLTRDSGPTAYTHADVPHPCAGPQCDPNVGCVGPQCWPQGRSLVVSVQDGARSLYLETIFPRYAQASQEVVKIPKDFLISLKAEFFTVRIHATKKHKVRAAFVFAGRSITRETKPLELVSAFHRRLRSEIKDHLTVKDGRYAETVPGDVIDLAWRPVGSVAAGTSRRYILKADGFYTRLSDAKHNLVGDDWYRKLDKDDRRILRSFKRQQTT